MADVLAQGSMKNAAKGDTWHELQTLEVPKLRTQSAPIKACCYEAVNVAPTQSHD